MSNAQEVAKYIIKNLPVDNLKLQKLLYYSQAVHLVLHNKTPLFPEDIEAWDYGPVVPPVYREYKPFGFEIITGSDDPTSLTIDEIKAVDMALAAFGDMTGPQLINQTHHETPWKAAYSSDRPSKAISLDIMYDYFKENLDFADDEI
jgi:uncharacterized phage-associated protein